MQDFGTKNEICLHNLPRIACINFAELREFEKKNFGDSTYFGEKDFGDGTE